MTCQIIPHGIWSKTHLSSLQLSFFLAALPAEWIQLIQIELPKKVARTAQQVTGEAQLSASFWWQLCSINTYLKVNAMLHLVLTYFFKDDFKCFNDYKELISLLWLFYGNA